MSPLIRRSLLEKFLLVVSCALPMSISAMAWAQQPAVRGAGGSVHTTAPPISHIPISSAPIIHAPITHAPMAYPPIFMHRDSVAPYSRAVGTVVFRPPHRPVRPFPPIFVIYQSPFFLSEPFWGLNSCWWASCDLFWSWPVGYMTVSSPGPISYISQTYETTVDVYGEEKPDLPQLFMKDGTILYVTDYWLVDDQLHFTMIDEDGGKPMEHVIPFDVLDLQTTVDANTRRGFRFMLRNEPFEQYSRDHPEGPPPIVTTAPK
jgi:hypothetical protein